MAEPFSGYGLAEDHALRALLYERIRELWAYRQWWRTNRWADWPVVRVELHAELRILVGLARKARRMAATAPDPIAAARWDADRRDHWTAA